MRSPPATAPATETLADLGITKTQSSKWQKLAALPEDKFEIRVEHAKARVENMTTSAPSNSKEEYIGENEWFTPAEYIEKARETPGGSISIPHHRPCPKDSARRHVLHCC